MAEEKGKHILVAALDFGTTYSGYAFSFSDDPEKIICNKNWGASSGFQSYKTPTSILTNGAGEFVAMGYDAEEKYTEETEDGASADLHLFRHFKMRLHKTKDVKLKALVTSEDGKIHPAVEIFGYAIGFLMEHMSKAIKASVATEVKPTDILWVITVPAIWSEPAKKFMREAAKRGGIVSDVNAKNLILSLEPEAASMCCRRPAIAGYRSEEGLTFPPNTKYLILDCGGGTVDITAHRTVVDDKIEEILPASGGPWGGMYVDREFVRLLETIFGKDFLNRFIANHPQSWFQMITAFETTKKAFDGIDKNSLKVLCPWSFGDFYARSKGGKNVKDAIKAFGSPGVAFANGSIIVRGKTAIDLFKPVLEQIVSHVARIIERVGPHELRYIFMVGGFSESQLLQNAIREKFGKDGTKVMIPEATQLAVLRGAVLFGHFQTEITTRIARRTYGYRGSEKFNPDIHNANKTYVNTNGVKKCDYIFKTLVTQGDAVPIGKEITVKTHPRRLSVCTFTRIYALDGLPKRPVQYTDDSIVEELGRVKCYHDLSKAASENNMLETFRFGSTELQVSVYHQITGKESEGTFEFLSDPSLE